jgi:Domain of unknown function (DUF4499)
MQHNKVLVMHQGLEIAEHGWLICGLFWVAMGTLAVVPFGSIAQAGRVLFWLTLFVHAVEALYVAFRARTAKLNVQTWFLKTIVLGALALLRLAIHLKQAPHRRLVR